LAGYWNCYAPEAYYLHNLLFDSVSFLGKLSESSRLPRTLHCSDNDTVVGQKIFPFFNYIGALIAEAECPTEAVENLK